MTGGENENPQGARRWRRPLGTAGLVLILALALVETVQALVAPALAPDDGDWKGAAAAVRAGFRPGDLIVAAPAWSDQVMRLHLGDLVPVPVAGRLDDARFSRVWEISQRGARAPEARGTVAAESDHGALTVRRWERPAAPMRYDFLASWDKARVYRQNGDERVPCARDVNRHQCPDLGYNFVKPSVLEIGNTLRYALYAQPVGGATVVIAHDDVPLGKQLAVGAGLHHVWHRKNASGTVRLQVFVDDEVVLDQTSGNRTGWQVDVADTSKWAGSRVPVRFEITSAEPFSRHFGFAAEARG